VRLVVNAVTGAVAQKLDYDAWGNVLVNENPTPGVQFQPFGFAGGLFDVDTGLVHFGKRDYDPSVGRWTAKDPILFGAGDPNLYRYAGGDPVNLIDPSGLDWTNDIIIIGGYVPAALQGGLTAAAFSGQEELVPIFDAGLVALNAIDAYFAIDKATAVWTMAGDRSRDGRKKFDTAQDAQDQVQDLENERAATPGRIQSARKSEQRFDNELKRIRTAEDAEKEFSGDDGSEKVCK